MAIFTDFFVGGISFASLQISVLLDICSLRNYIPHILLVRLLQGFKGVWNIPFFLQLLTMHQALTWHIIWGPSQEHYQPLQKQSMCPEGPVFFPARQATEPDRTQLCDSNTHKSPSSPLPSQQEPPNHSLAKWLR